MACGTMARAGAEVTMRKLGDLLRGLGPDELLAGHRAREVTGIYDD